ncbi:RNA-directed DNA polymerase from mobile element jockey [Trichonephila inaurata madagascariensis]|nr:RNA-directed DNA polymerase from mobile element jockey [Trichonephila inaurata madagascariensis]
MTILVGNFNAKHTSWGCPYSDTRGNRLYRYIVSNSIDVFAPSTPTRFGTASASIIDYTLIKNLNWPCTIDSISELSSDHNPVKLHFPRTAKFELPQPNVSSGVFLRYFSDQRKLLSTEGQLKLQEIESQVVGLPVRFSPHMFLHLGPTTTLEFHLCVASQTTIQRKKQSQKIMAIHQTPTTQN